MSRVRDVENRFYALIRHGDAASVADAEPGGVGLEGLEGSDYCLVVTYRRGGTPVPTPVWFALDAGRLVFEADADSGKVKRLRRDPRVRVAPCNSRGRPSGPPVEARGRLLAGDEAETAERLLAERYGVSRRIAQRLRPVARAGPAHVEVTASG